jgi:hypothetical protein
MAKSRGGSRSRLEKHGKWLLTLIAKQPDLTLDEAFAAMRSIGSFERTFDAREAFNYFRHAGYAYK